MQRGIIYEAAKLNIARKRHSRWLRAVSALAAVVVFVTTYALILPVITMESEYVCGMPAHQHDESCLYTPIIDTGRSLSCAVQPHVHEAGCYSGEELVCGYADFMVHSHDSACFDAEGNLLCLIEAHSEHSHSAECYHEERLYNCGLTETEGHLHSEACWSQPQFGCGLEEGEGHSHGEACYSPAPFVCTLEESPGHSHEAGCYGEAPLLCTLELSEEHAHGPECYGAAPLICGLEESPGHSHGAECFGPAELICALDEAPAHYHDDSCMSAPQLICGMDESPAHVHDESCGMVSRLDLVCSLEEIVLHTHEAECFDANGVLICEEIQVLAHQHDAGCFTEHKHTDACWQLPDSAQPAEAGAEAPTESAEKVLRCPYHEHVPACFDAEGNLLCTQPVLICGMDEHQHSDACRPQEDDGTVALIFSVSEEYAPYIASDVSFPYTCRVPVGSSLAQCTELPQIRLLTPEGGEPLYAEKYHWLLSDGLPVDENAPIDTGLELSLRLYPAEEAERAELVELSFVCNDEVLLRRSVYPGTLVSTLLDHDIQVKLDEMKSESFRFEGWFSTDAEGNELPLQYGITTAEQDAVYTARFRQYVPLTLHDIAPSGLDREASPLELYIPMGSSLLQLQETTLFDGSALTDCLWFKADGTAHDIGSALTEAMELYTYSYTLLLDMGSDYEEELTTEVLSGFVQADFFLSGGSAASPSAAVTSDDDSSGDNVLIAKRSGEVITQEDFLVDGVDYTDYIWNDAEGNEVDADSLVGTSLTANYSLALAAAASYTIKYDINVAANTVFGTVPTVGGGATFTEYFSTDQGSYAVRVPNPTRYMVVNGNKKLLYQFTGWRAQRTGNGVALGETVTANWIKSNADRYNGSTITLVAQWSPLETKDTVHFFVNLNCQMEEVDGSSHIPSAGSFTPSVYSTTITVSGRDMMDHWQGAISGGSQFIVTRAEKASDTALIDREIRQLISGYDSSNEQYNGRSVWDDDYTGTKIFQVGDFPSDEQVLSVVRGMVASGTVIRMNGVPIPATDLTTDKFTVRWNVCKYDSGDGWHIDGLLVGKQAHLTVKKTFMGDDGAVQAVKAGSYSITITNTSAASAPVYLSLKPAAEETAAGYIGYSSYSPASNSYTWTVPLVQENKYTLQENNYISADPAIQSSAAYTISNSPDAFAGWLTYPSGGISGINGYAYADDVPVNAYQTVEIRNTYVKSDTLTINKIDKGTGNGLPGVSYRISDASGNDLSLYKKPDASYYSMKAEDMANGFEPCPDGIITTGSNGTIFLKLDSGTFTLREAFPTGYGGASTVTVTVGADSSGNVVFEEVISSDSTIEVEGVLVDADTASLSIYNVSQPTSVTARKVWVGIGDKEPVTVALYRDGVAMGTRYQALLNSGNNWTHTWDDLPLYADGKAAQYSLREIKIGDTAYDPSADADGYSGYIVSSDDIVYFKDDEEVSRPAWLDDAGVTQYADSALLTVRNEIYRGQLMFMKVDEEGRALPGATFRLYRDEELTRLVAEAVSDGNGRVMFENLVPNTYYAAKEDDSPEGYLNDDSVYRVRLSAQGGTLIENLATGEKLNRIVNYTDQVKVNLLKRSSLGNDLAGVEFELFLKDDDKHWQSLGTFTTGDDGRVSLGTLSHGSYRLTELHPPDGYLELSGPIEFDIDKGKLILVTTGDWSTEEELSGDLLIRVINRSGYELPQTGGTGWRFGYAAALVFLAMPLLLWLRRKVFREEGRSSF